MARLVLENLTKDFGALRAVDHVSLEVEDGEFVVILGPSGAGKTTTLKLIAGVETPTAGKVYIDNRMMNAIEPHNRNVAMAFESYALYPHYTVEQNLAFPLKAPGRDFSPEIINQRVREVAELLNIHMLMDRLPRMLSNGQKQRVALGRAMVREPEVLLLDEPISHLDAKLRHRMRTEFKALGSRIRSTTIYVTHDYLEAMSLADRLVVLNVGTVCETGTPRELFEHPADMFVAQLLGHPQMNFIECNIQRTEGQLRLISTDSALHVDIPNALQDVVNASNLDSVVMGIRPQHIHTPETGGDVGIVYVYERLGTKGVLTVTIGDHRIDILTAIEADYKIDETVHIALDNTEISLFDPNTQKNLLVG